MTFNMMMKTMMVAAAAMLSPVAAMAHDGMGPNGGRLADTSTHHLELVMRNDGVEVFVSDKASRPIPASGLTGLAIVVAGGASTRIPLAGDGTRLLGKTAVNLPDHAKGIVRVKLGDGQTIQASFD